MLRVGATGIEEEEDDITCRIYLTSELSRFNYIYLFIPILPSGA
jgi:hypothetical protein